MPSYDRKLPAELEQPTRARDVVAFLARAELALARTPEIGPELAGARYGFKPKALSAAISAVRVRTGPRYVVDPPEDLMELARRLGYSRKEVMRMQAAHGTDGLRKRFQTEWRQNAQERPEFLPRNPARPPTTNPADSIEDGQIVRVTPDLDRRLQRRKVATWEQERQVIEGAIQRLKEAGLGNGELFLMQKRLDALDRRLREAA